MKSAIPRHALRARSLSPNTVRWLSMDPLGLFPDLNRFRYVRNSLATFVDPSGLKQTEEPECRDPLQISIRDSSYWEIFDPRNPYKPQHMDYTFRIIERCFPNGDVEVSDVSIVEYNLVGEPDLLPVPLPFPVGNIPVPVFIAGKNYVDISNLVLRGTSCPKGLTGTCQRVTFTAEWKTAFAIGTVFTKPTTLRKTTFVYLACCCKEKCKCPTASIRGVPDTPKIGPAPK